MVSKDLHEALNAHLSKELKAAYLYLSMAAYFEGTNFTGFAAWMKAQAKEEYGHAMKFWDHIYDREKTVTLLTLEQPPGTFKSPLDAFEEALDHERAVTEDIHKLYARAVDDKDYATEVFLQWFVTEQVEEEKMITQIVDNLRMVGDSPASLLILDRELGGRAATE